MLGFDERGEWNLDGGGEKEDSLNVVESCNEVGDVEAALIVLLAPLSSSSSPAGCQSLDKSSVLSYVPVFVVICI